MTENDLKNMLDDFRKLPTETEWLEFKKAKNNYDFDDLGKYFSALSNEANLKRQDYGWLIFGIEDNRHDIVGTNFRINRGDLDSLKKEIADHTNNRLTFREIYELIYPEGRVILFQIPAASLGIPTSWKGHYYGRDHESLVPLSLDELEIMRKQAISFKFEKEIALKSVDSDTVLKLLDYPAYFYLMQENLPTNKDAILDKFIQEKLIVKDGNAFSITNLGAILFAKNLNSFEKLSRKAVRIIQYESNNRLKTNKEKVFEKGYAAGFEELINYINDKLPVNEEIVKALRKEVKMYPELAIRELIANALIHQDYYEIGTSPTVEIFNDRIEITNPGKPLINTLRFIDHPPQSRNESLASLMRRARICEERGSGIDKVVFQIESYWLPAPNFIEGDKFLKVIMYAHKKFKDMDKQDKVRACYQHCCLVYVSGDKMDNESLRKRFDIEKNNYPMVS
ncbi:MAG: ATP-binding protein, partial [Lentisphaerota bacterium]